MPTTRIKVRSPYYKKYSHANLNYVELDIHIYTGSFTSGLAGTPKYSLKKYEIATNNYVVFEVSELIRDYIDTEFDGTYDNEPVWVYLAATLYESDGTQIGSVDNTYLLAFDGYTLFEEGINYTTDAPVFITDRVDTPTSEVTIYRPSDEVIRIPVNVDNTDGNETGWFYKLIEPNDDTQNGDFEYVSETEEITNGGFDTDSDWEKNAGITISDGKSNFTGVSGSYLSQEINISSSKTYRINFTVLSGSNALTIFLGAGNNVYSGSDYNIGQNTIYAVAGGVDSKVYFGNLFAGSIDNVSVKEVGQTSVTNSSDSDDQIYYISVGTQYNKVELWEEPSGMGLETKVYTIHIEEMDCNKYDAIKVTFYNRWGALQDLFFTAKHTQSLRTKGEDYKSNLIDFSTLSYSTTRHQAQTFHKQGKERITLNTGNVNEDYNEWIKELMLSEKVWMTKDSTVYPIKVISSNFRERTSINDKIFNYTIEAEYAFDKVQNIR